MSGPRDESFWQRRLAIYTAVRLVGIAIFFVGVAIAYSNLVRPGGWPQVGAVVAILGALASLLLPRTVKRAWDREDREQS
jgi:membrane associated rhomboid family serine protease